MFSSYQVNVPQLYADVDRTRGASSAFRDRGVRHDADLSRQLLCERLQPFGRTYSVRVQADAPYRARAEDWPAQVRSNSGEMCRWSALLNVKPSFGPERAMRYNGFLSAESTGATRRASRLARRRTRWNASPPRRCRRASATKDRDHLPGDPRRHSAVWVFRSRSCSCSWCSPHSTRAWCCRSPSS